MDPLVTQLLDALGKSIDPAKLHASFARPAAQPITLSDGSHEGRDDVLGKLVLADILEPSILGARPGDKSFPLRILLSKIGESLPSDAAFSFACGLGFYFRASMDEESRMRLGIEVSRAFYRFAGDAEMEHKEIVAVAPLLATLMNGELERLRFESVDHTAVFDSQVHERDPAGDATSSRIEGARTFLCRVGKTNVIRAKAMVRT